jgi:hypothetical protein
VCWTDFSALPILSRSLSLGVFLVSLGSSLVPPLCFAFWGVGPLLLFLFSLSTLVFSLSFPPPAPPGLGSRARMYLFHKSSSLDGSIGINLISGPVAPTLPTLYFHDDPASQRLIPLPCLSWDGLLQEGRVRSASVDGRPRLGQSKSSPALRPGPLDPRVVRVRSLAIKLKFLFASEAEIFTAVLSNESLFRHPTSLIHGDPPQLPGNLSSTSSLTSTSIFSRNSLSDSYTDVFVAPTFSSDS